MIAKKNHYLVVADQYNLIEILNCSQVTFPSDTVIAELTKDDYYGIEELARSEGMQGSFRGEDVETFQKYYDKYFGASHI